MLPGPVRSCFLRNRTGFLITAFSKNSQVKLSTLWPVSAPCIWRHPFNLCWEYLRFPLAMKGQDSNTDKQLKFVSVC